MKLFAFQSQNTGPSSYFVMSETVEDAIESIGKMVERPNDIKELTDPERYTIEIYGENEPTWSENA